jgi:hypothetical protein
MSTSLLHQAVQLAQAGQRVEARQMLLQFIQTEPNNEVAWLWLASVAADQVEYQRALNEVLRINPANQRAQQLLSDLQQQQYGGGIPPAAPQYAPPQQVSPYAPPAPQPYSPPAPRPQYDMAAPGQQPLSAGSPYIPVAPQPVEVKIKRERRGCLGCSLPGCGCLGCGGCGPGCLLALVVLIVLPTLLCAGLSMSPLSLGPFDFFASFLPGEMGRKEIKFETDTHAITLNAPRSWYLVQTNDQMWSMWRDALDEGFPFADTDTTWADLESFPGTDALIVETNIVVLAEGGNMTGLALPSGTVSGDFTCASVRAEYGSLSFDYPVVYEYDDNLCGYREEDQVVSGPSDNQFKDIAPPDEMRTITFYVPVSATTATQWVLSLPENEYGRFDDDIDALIESVKIETK